MSDGFKKFIVFILLIVVGYLCYYYVKNKDNNYVPTPETKEVVKKEYDNLDYVFDAKYSTSTVKLPYINLDYNGVRSINFQIKNLNDNKVEEADYEYSIHDKILSIIVRIKTDMNNYYTYNINMTNGKELSYDDVSNKYSIKDISLKEKIGEYIDNSEEIQSHLDDIVITKEKIVDTSYDNYKTSALSNNIKYYVDSNNRMNVVIKIELKEVYYEYAVFSL